MKSLSLLGAYGTPAVDPEVVVISDTPSITLDVQVQPQSSQTNVDPRLSAASIHDELEKRLPPEQPRYHCDPELVKKIRTAVVQGQSVVARLKDHTAFKNPEILAQLVKIVDLDERGSNYPTDVFDPKAPFPDHVTLAERQNAFLASVSGSTKREKKK